MASPFETAGRAAMAAQLRIYGEAVTVMPWRRGDFSAGPDSHRLAVECVAIVRRTADIERLMGEQPGDKWGANAAVYPITVYLAADDFVAALPQAGDRIARAAAPAGQPANVEIARVGDIRAGRLVLFCTALS